MHSVLRWSELRSSFLNLATNPNSTFEDKVYQMRHLVRCGLYEIGSRTVQSTIISSFVISLQHLAQEAYLLIQQGQSAQILMPSLRYQIVLYALTLTTLLAFDYGIRIYRHYFFTEYTKKISRQAMENIDDNLFKAKAASNSRRSDNKGSIDAIKDFYSVTFCIIMAPIELLTYLYMLGPTLLLTIAALTVIAGFVQNKFASRGNTINIERLDRADKLAASGYVEYSNHSDRLLNTRRKERFNEINKDFSIVTVKYAFQVLSALICVLYVIEGRWDMALMSAQASAALIAFTRLLKYLENITGIARFRSYMEFKLDLISLRGIRNEHNGPLSTRFVSDEIGAYQLLNNIQDRLASISLQELKMIIKDSHSGYEYKDADRQVIQASNLLGIVTVVGVFDAISNDDATRDERWRADVNTMIDQWKGNKAQWGLDNDTIDRYIDKKEEVRREICESQPLMIPTSTKIQLYILATVIVFGVMFTPVSSPAAIIAMLPAMTTKLKVSLGLFTVFCLHQASLVNDVAKITANPIYKAGYLLLCFAGFYFTPQLHPVLSYSFVVGNARSIGTALAVTYLSLFMVTDFALQSLGAGVHVIATWAAQDAVLLAQQPSAAAEFVREKASAYTPKMQSLSKGFSIPSVFGV